MDIGGGRRIPYPPVHPFIDYSGERVYLVQLRDRTDTIVGDEHDLELSPEEGIEMIHQTLREALEAGIYHISDFELPDSQVNTEGRHAQVVNMQFPYAVMVDEHGREEEQDEAFSRHCIGRMPASAEAIRGLMETSMKEGECSVCLMDFDSSSKLRLMPCSHCFHEHCIFTWLQLNHVCPLCRFPLPTGKQQ